MTPRPRTSGRVVAAIGAALLLLATAAPVAAQDSGTVSWDDLGLTAEQELFLTYVAEGMVPLGPWSAYAVVEENEVAPGSDDVSVTAGVRLAVPPMTVEQFIAFVTAAAPFSFLPLDTAYFPQGTGVIVTALEVDTDLSAGAASLVEITLWHALGLQAFAPRPGLRTPDIDQSEGLGIVCRTNDLSSVYVLGSAPGQQFSTPYPVGFFVLPSGVTLLVFATRNDVPARVSVTRALDPADPGSYTVREGTLEVTDAPVRPDRPTEEMVELAAVLGWYERPVLPANPPADLDTDRDGIPIIELDEPPPGGSNDGLEWKFVVVPVTMAGAIVTWLLTKRWRRREISPATNQADPLQPFDQAWDPATRSAARDRFIANAVDVAEKSALTLDDRGIYRLTPEQWMEAGALTEDALARKSIGWSWTHLPEDPLERLFVFLFADKFGDHPERSSWEVLLHRDTGMIYYRNDDGAVPVDPQFELNEATLDSGDEGGVVIS